MHSNMVATTKTIPPAQFQLAVKAELCLLPTDCVTGAIQIHRFTNPSNCQRTKTITSLLDYKGRWRLTHGSFRVDGKARTLGKDRRLIIDIGDENDREAIAHKS